MRNYTNSMSALPADCALVPSAFVVKASLVGAAWARVERVKGAAPIGSIQIPQMSELVGTSLSAHKGLVQVGATVQTVGDVRGVPPRGRPV